MTFEEFRRLILLFGGSVIVTTTILIASLYNNPEEAVGQMLFAFILIGAVYYGVRGGVITGLISSSLYAILLIPTVLEHGMVATLPILVFRVIIYVATGIIGGQICIRIKYMLAALEGDGLIDNETRLFKSSHFIKLIRVKMEQFDRYRSPFCLVNLTIQAKAMDDLPPKERARKLRQIGTIVREDIRLSDDAGRLNTNTISALMPYTPVSGAEVAAKRLYSKALRVFGNEENIDYEIVMFPDNREKIEELVGSVFDPTH